MQPRFEPYEDLHAPEIYPHPIQRYKSPPYQLPKKKWKGFKHFRSKLRKFDFGP